MVRVRHLTLAALLGIGVIAHAGLSAGASSSDPSTSPLAARPPHEPTPETPLNIITFDSATSTCIVKPVTPLCAVETLLACHIRGVKTPCPFLNRTKSRPDWHYQDDRPGNIIKYRIRSLERLSRKTIPPEKRKPYDPYSWKPGDMRITLEIIECNDVYPMCESNRFVLPRITYYIVRDNRQGWRIVDFETVPR